MNDLTIRAATPHDITVQGNSNATRSAGAPVSSASVNRVGHRAGSEMTTSTVRLRRSRPEAV
jgi:hypothetical protein